MSREIAQGLKTQKVNVLSVISKRASVLRSWGRQLLRVLTFDLAE